MWNTRSLVGWLLLLVTAGLTLACAHAYRSSRPIAGSSSAPVLRGDATAYIARPADAGYGGRVYRGSAESVTSELARALGPHLRGIEVATQVESFEAALETAQDDDHDYLIFPEIKHWEDRATEWSGKSDQIEIRITVFDGPSGEMLDAVDLHGKSRWGTLGGDHPQDLLAVPIERYASELAGTGTR